MTTRAERRVTVPAPIDDVWSFIADPRARAAAISVVDSYEIHDAEGRRATWHVRLPIPFVSATIAVDTEELIRRPPTHVRFVGRSPVFEVIGEHELTTIDDDETTLISRFTVDGHVPGVESFFKHNLDRELENLERSLFTRIQA